MYQAEKDNDGQRLCDTCNEPVKLHCFDCLCDHWTCGDPDCCKQWQIQCGEGNEEEKEASEKERLQAQKLNDQAKEKAKAKAEGEARMKAETEARASALRPASLSSMSQK